MFAEVREIRSRPAPTSCARRVYSSNWHVLKVTAVDSLEFAESWDEILRLEGVFEFSVKDFKSMREQAHLHLVGA